MTNTYEKIKERSRVYRLFQRVSLIGEYKDNRGAPPPFNLLTLLAWLVSSHVSALPTSAALLYPTVRLHNFLSFLEPPYLTLRSNGVAGELPCLHPAHLRCLTLFYHSVTPFLIPSSHLRT